MNLSHLVLSVTQVKCHSRLFVDYLVDKTTSTDNHRDITLSSPLTYKKTMICNFEH